MDANKQEEIIAFVLRSILLAKLLICPEHLVLSHQT